MFNMGCENECRFYCQLHFIPWSKYRGRLNTIDILSATPQFRAGRFILSLDDRAHIPSRDPSAHIDYQLYLTTADQSQTKQERRLIPGSRIVATTSPLRIIHSPTGHTVAQDGGSQHPLAATRSS
jgi:hypothetical protein